jgi:Uma2 family endonuclease
MTELAQATRLTAEDLPYLAPDEGLCELVAGEVVREPPPGEEHGRVAANVLILMGGFVRERGLGRSYGAETGFVLTRDPDTVRAPDAAFVSAARLRATARRGPYFEGAPDLAVEVISPSNSGTALAGKVRDYLAAGAQAVWVVDPSRRTLTVHRPGLFPETLASSDVLDGGFLLPGLRLLVRDLFEP